MPVRERTGLRVEEERRLAHFEVLLDTAGPDDLSTLTEIERALLPLIEGIAARRRPRPICSDREQVDIRRTVREYLRQGEFLRGLAYLERPRERQLVLLVDLTESFLPFAAWGAMVAIATHRVVPGATVWGFDRLVHPLDQYCAHLGTFLAATRPAIGTAQLCLADLRYLLDQVSRHIPGAVRIEAWIVSDLLLPPGRLVPVDFPRTAGELRAFSRICILDPTTLYARYEDPESGKVTIPGRALPDLMARGDARWRQAEGEQIVMLDPQVIGRLATDMADKPVLMAQRLTPWLRALAPSVRLISRRPDHSSLAELFFGE